MTNPKKEPKEITPDQKLKDAMEAHQRATEAAWKNKSQKEKIDSLAAGFSTLYQGYDKIAEGQEILSNLNAANHFMMMAIIKVLKLDKNKIAKLSNEMFAKDYADQEKEAKKNVLPVQNQKPKA